MSYGKFIETVSRIAKIIADAKALDRLPSDYAHDVAKLEIYHNGYRNPKETSGVLAVKAAIKSAQNSERQRGERERDEKKALLAIELNSLCSVLPSLSASASVELGCIARKKFMEPAP